MYPFGRGKEENPSATCESCGGLGDGLATVEVMTDQLNDDLEPMDTSSDVLEEAEISSDWEQSQSTQDALDDGVDLAVQLDDSKRSDARLDGVVPLDEEIVTDDLTTSETIEDRIQQEEPDPNSDIVPPNPGRRN